MVQKSIKNQTTSEVSPSDVDLELSPPRPLSLEQFTRIVVLNQIKEMSSEEFKNTFRCEPIQENIEKLITDVSCLPPDFINSCQESWIEIVKMMQNFALDGKPEISWNIAESYASFTPEELQYINAKSNGDPDMHPYIKTRFSEISDVLLTLDFVETVEMANTISSLTTTAVSMKNAEKLYNKLRYYEKNLEDEQKASIYFLSSEVFRRSQIVPGIYHEPKPCSKEIFCLRMVLDNTAEPGMVDCCLNRLSAHTDVLKQNIPQLINAYKRVIKKQNTIFPEDKYRINTQIAQLYQKSMGQACNSFTGLSIQETSTLHWAEYYYRQAAKEAPTNIKKYDAMMSISDIQVSLGMIDKAHRTAQNAVKLLPQPDCYERALDLVAKDRKYAIPTIKRTLKKINQANIPVGIKNILYNKALQITHQKTKDAKVISSVEKLLPNRRLTPNNKIVRNVSTRE